MHAQAGRVWVRGDDFCALGDQDAVNDLDGVLRGDSGDIFLTWVLRAVHSENRAICDTEGDPRHSEVSVSELGLASKEKLLHKIEKEWNLVLETDCLCPQCRLERTRCDTKAWLCVQYIPMFGADLGN